MLETGTPWHAAAVALRACTEYSSQNRLLLWWSCLEKPLCGTEGLVAPSTSHPRSHITILPPRFLSSAFLKALFDPGFGRTKQLPLLSHFVVSCTQHAFCHIIFTKTMHFLIQVWFRLTAWCMQWQCPSKLQLVRLILGCYIMYFFSADHEDSVWFQLCHLFSSKKKKKSVDLVIYILPNLHWEFWDWKSARSFAGAMQGCYCQEPKLKQESRCCGHSKSVQPGHCTISVTAGLCCCWTCRMKLWTNCMELPVNDGQGGWTTVHLMTVLSPNSLVFFCYWLV